MLLSQQEIEVRAGKTVFIEKLLGLIPAHVADNPGLDFGVLTGFVSFFLELFYGIFDLLILGRVTDVLLDLFHYLIVLEPRLQFLVNFVSDGNIIYDL